MLEGIFGSNLLKSIIQEYVKSSGSTSTQEYLFDIMQTQIDKANVKLPASVKDLLETWINVAGYPMVKLTRHYGDTSVTITQKRFINDVDKTNKDQWPKQYIPISISSAESPDFKNITPSFWLTPNAANISYTMQPSVSSSSWIIVNNQQMGFYRVNYDRSNWHLLINALKRKNFDNIPVLNRAQLIDDSFNLARNGERTFDIAFGVMSYLRGETDFIPWKTAARSLNHLERMLRGQIEYDQYEVFVRNLTQLVYNLVPVTRNETNHTARLQRLDVAKLACRAGIKKCLDEVKNTFDEIVSIMKL